jgi:transcriptional regulator with XRE-family HTH domain
MVAQSSVSSASPSDGEDDTSRLHIRGIKEMPAGQDEELATIFREMRRAANVPREKMARRLKTSIETLDALESGAIFALPPWPELSRIVTAYAAMLGLDSRPLLRRLEAQLFPDEGLTVVSPPIEAASTPAPASAAPIPAPEVTQTAKPGGPPMPTSAASPVATPAPAPPDAAPSPQDAAMPPPEAKAAAQPSGTAQAAGEKVQPQYRMEDAAFISPEVEVPPKRSSGYLKRVLNWLVLIGFIAALGSGVWYAAQRPQMVWSALDTLPDPIPSAVRSAWKFMRPLEGKAVNPQITDPDNRKSDKLP